MPDERDAFMKRLKAYQIDRDTLMILWFGVFVYLDMTVTQQLEDPNLIMMKSAVLVASVMLVTLYSEVRDD